MGITSNSFSSSEPFDPSFMTKAGDTAGQLMDSAKTSAAAQQARLQDYIKHLMTVRDMARLAARGAGARGANGMQNPLSVYKSLNQLSEQAGIPIDAEIQKAIQGSNNIENTMNDMIGKAGSLYTQLAGIMKSNSGSSGGGGNAGGGHTSKPDPNGNFIDIYGNKMKDNPADTARNAWLKQQYEKDTPGGDPENQSAHPVWSTDFEGQKTNGMAPDQSEAPQSADSNFWNEGASTGGMGFSGSDNIMKQAGQYLEQLPGWTTFHTSSPMDASSQYAQYAKDFNQFNPTDYGSSPQPQNASSGGGNFNGSGASGSWGIPETPGTGALPQGSPFDDFNESNFFNSMGSLPSFSPSNYFDSPSSSGDNQA